MSGLEWAARFLGLRSDRYEPPSLLNRSPSFSLFLSLSDIAFVVENLITHTHHHHHLNKLASLFSFTQKIFIIGQIFLAKHHVSLHRAHTSRIVLSHHGYIRPINLHQIILLLLLLLLFTTHPTYQNPNMHPPPPRRQHPRNPHPLNPIPLPPPGHLHLPTHPLRNHRFQPSDPPRRLGNLLSRSMHRLRLHPQRERNLSLLRRRPRRTLSATARGSGSEETVVV